jgi:hypothetical protein
VEQDAQTIHAKSLKLLIAVKNAVYAAGLIHKVPIALLWKGMWNQVTSYFVISSKYFATIVFG